MARYIPKPSLAVDPGHFLANHWQRQPLLLRGALGNWHNPLAPEDIAGLCLEEVIESRLVIAPSAAQQRWQLEHGPLPEDRFTHLTQQGWSILVQAIDHWFEDYAVLFDAFDFIPAWQRDDIMISYATTGGGVGPHFDHYDVFLVQVAGHRRWELGQRCDDSNAGYSALESDQPMQLLQQFNVEQQYDVAPGDVLYVPPYQSHCGTELDDHCITVSVGFRAPSLQDVLTGYDALQDARGDCADPARLLRPAIDHRVDIGARLSDSDIQSIASQLENAPKDEQDFARWFARHASQRRYPIEEAQMLPCDGELACTILKENPAATLYRSGSARLFYRSAFSNGAGSCAYVYVDGVEFELLGERPAAELNALLARCCNPRYSAAGDWLALAETGGGGALASYLLEESLLDVVAAE